MPYKTCGCHSFIVIIESMPTIRLPNSFLSLSRETSRKESRNDKRGTHEQTITKIAGKPHKPTFSAKTPPRSPQRRTKQPNPRHKSEPRRLYRPRRRPHRSRRATPPVLAKLPDQNPIQPQILTDHTREAKRQHRTEILPRSHFVHAHQNMQSSINHSDGDARFRQNETRGVV
jgi:hypothetical protein